MALLHVEVTTPKAVGINLSFANGKAVSVPPGGTVRGLMLTGDELGRLEATLDSGRRQAKREGALDEEVMGGGVKVLSPGYYDPPAVGSKKHRMLHPDEYDGDGIHVSKKEKAADKLAKPAKGKGSKDVE